MAVSLGVGHSDSRFYLFPRMSHYHLPTRRCGRRGISAEVPPYARSPSCPASRHIALLSEFTIDRNLNKLSSPAVKSSARNWPYRETSRAAPIKCYVGSLSGRVEATIARNYCGTEAVVGCRILIMKLATEIKYVPATLKYRHIFRLGALMMLWLYLHDQNRQSDADEGSNSRCLHEPSHQAPCRNTSWASAEAVILWHHCSTTKNVRAGSDIIIFSSLLLYLSINQYSTRSE